MILEIKQTKGLCDMECVFRDADIFDRAGKCLLFNDVLRPEMKYGEVEGWESCRACNQVCRKYNSLNSDES